MAAQQIPAIANNVEDMEMEQQENELTAFEIFGMLPPELRDHSLSYADYKTMLEYAQCSKLCKKEFEKFEIPYRVELLEVGGVAVVRMTYKITGRVKSKTFTIYDDRRERMDMRQYVMECFNGSEYGPMELVVNMNYWPTTVLFSDPLRKAKEWHVTVNSFMYNGFMELVEVADAGPRNYIMAPKKLYLKDCDEIENRVAIRSRLFKLIPIKVLHKLKISTNIEITHEDFVEFEFDDLELTNWCDEEAIRKKVERTEGDTSEEITIVLPLDNDQTFDIAQLFPEERFAVQYSERYPEIFKIGRYVVGTTYMGGKKLNLRFFFDFEESKYDFDEDGTEEDTVEYDYEDYEDTEDNEDVEDHEDNTMKFTKYEILSPEARHHILTYTDMNTIKEYSMCSKQCKQEFDKFEYLHRIELQEDEDGIAVTLIYKGIKKVESVKFLFPDAMEDARQYIMSCSKGFDNKAVELVIDMKTWPESIVSLPQIASNWHVTMRQSMYDGFMNFARLQQCEDENGVIVSLCLKNCDEVEERVIIEPQFFKIEFIKRLRELHIFTKFQLDRQDFLNCKFETFEVTSWIDMESIRQKVENNGGNFQGKIWIDLTAEEEKAYYIDQLFPPKRFKIRYFESTGRHIQIGDHVLGFKSDNGKSLYLTFCNDAKMCKRHLMQLYEMYRHFEIDVQSDSDEDGEDEEDREDEESDVDDDDNEDDESDVTDNDTSEEEFDENMEDDQEISEDDDDEKVENTDKDKVDTKEIEVITLSDDDDEDMEIGQQDIKHAMSDQSAPKEGTLKRIMENSNNLEGKRQKIELPPFTYFEVMVSKLRRHVLTYLDNGTLKQYAQCSKECEKEFRRIALPYRIELEEMEHCLVVKLCTRDTTEIESKTFKLSSGKCMEVVKQYISERYQHFGYKPKEVVVNMKTWPTLVVNMPEMEKTKKWHVTINKSMYNDFVEWTRTKEYRKEDCYSIIPAYLYLKNCDNIDERVVVGSEFFSSDFISTLSKLDIATDFQYSRDDFLASLISDLQVTSWKDFDAIRESVKRANGPNNHFFAEKVITIALCPNDDMTFNIEELFPSEQFPKIKQSENNWKIGDHVVVSIFGMGKSLCLTLNEARKIWNDEDLEGDEESSDDDDETDNEEEDIYDSEDEEKKAMEVKSDDE